jgi:predicted transcriptional regulator
MSRKNKVINRMKQLDITHSQIAQHALLSKIIIKDWMDGKIEIPYSYVWKIYDLLNLNFDEDITTL